MALVYLTALAHFFLSLYVAVRAFSSREVSYFPLGFLSIFSIGYYVLPIIFLEWSGLSSYGADEILDSQLIFLLHAAMIVLGHRLAITVWHPRKFTHQGLMGEFLSRNWHWSMLLCAALFTVYYVSAEKTSYSSSDFEAYFLERDKLFVITNAIGQYAMALLALLLALTAGRVARGVWLLSLAFYAVMVALLGIGGQRLLLLTPILYLLSAFWIFGLRRAVFTGTMVAVLLLLVYSPLATALRGYEGENQGAERIAGALASYKSDAAGAKGIESSVRSIVERADLLENTIYLKSFFDKTGLVGLVYYSSGVVAVIPKLFYEGKPYPLSTDGTINGEISVRAWRLIRGETMGSLTAFGGITAYAQGYWLGVVVDGLFMGMFFVVWQRLLARMGILGAWVYILSFPILAVKRVPSSFLEAWVDCSGLIPLMLVMFLLGRIYILLRARVDP